MEGVDTGKEPHKNRLGCGPEMETGKVGAARGAQAQGHLSSNQEGKDQNNACYANGPGRQCYTLSGPGERSFDL